jgi:DME family drug/metabolite transporter
MLFLVIAGVLWGTGGLAGSLLQAQTGLHPLAVAAYRLLIGGVLATLTLAGRLKHLPRTKAAARRLAAAGALLAVFQASYFGGVTLTSVSLATLLSIGSAPVIVAVVTAIRDRKAPARRMTMAIGLAVLGLALLAGTPTAGDTWHTVGGVLLSLLAGGGFATFALVNQHPVAGLNGGTTISIGLLLGGLLLLPIALTLGMAVPLSPQVLLTAVFLGTVPTAIAYGAYFIGLRGSHPVAAVLASMLEPLTATVLSVMFFDDRLSTAGVIGAALLGVALASAQGGSATGERALRPTRRNAEVGS